MQLSVLMPVWNERSTIEEILRRVEAVPIEKEIIIVDNGSNDGTREFLTSLVESGRARWGKWTDTQHWNGIDHNADVLEAEAQGGSMPIRVVFQKANRGKGASVRRALRLARADWVIVQDADLEYDPNDLVKLLQAAREKQAAQSRRRRRRPVAVFGSRLLEESSRQAQSGSALYWGRVGLSRLFRLLYARSVTDVATCYKLMPRSVAQRLPLKSSGFDLDFEIAARLVRYGARIVEVPISYTPRSASQGKKLHAWNDGWRAARALLLYRFL
jgi:dolichol-phosphate mannosyltransferase